MPNENERNNGMQYRDLNIDAEAIRVIDDDQRILELSFSSETPVPRWGEYEILEHSSNAVMLERINKTGCLLFNHNRDKVIGKVLKAWIKNKRGYAQVQFDDDPDSIVYYNKAKNGTLRNTSVGYIVHETRREAIGKNENMKINIRATKWEPTEISLVTVPADITVGTNRAAGILPDEAATNNTAYNSTTPFRDLAERELLLNETYYNIMQKEV